MCVPLYAFVRMHSFLCVCSRAFIPVRLKIMFVKSGRSSRSKMKVHNMYSVLKFTAFTVRDINIRTSVEKKKREPEKWTKEGEKK